MKRTYQSPTTTVAHIIGEQQLLTSSLHIGGSVSDGDDIGFAKEDASPEDEEYWDFDW